MNVTGGVLLLLNKIWLQSHSYCAAAIEFLNNGGWNDKRPRDLTQDLVLHNFKAWQQKILDLCVIKRGIKWSIPIISLYRLRWRDFSIDLF